MAQWGESTSFAILSEGDDLVLAVRGAIDAMNTSALCRRLRVMCDLAGGGRVILDLRDADTLDQTAVGALRRSALRCRAQGVSFLLRDPPAGVLSALRAN
jgi:anti-anti-sigma factor